MFLFYLIFIYFHCIVLNCILDDLDDLFAVCLLLVGPKVK